MSYPTARPADEAASRGTTRTVFDSSSSKLRKRRPEYIEHMFDPFEERPARSQIDRSLTFPHDRGTGKTRHPATMDLQCQDRSRHGSSWESVVCLLYTSDAAD